MSRIKRLQVEDYKDVKYLIYFYLNKFVGKVCFNIEEFLKKIRYKCSNKLRNEIYSRSMKFVESKISKDYVEKKLNLEKV